MMSHAHDNLPSREGIQMSASRPGAGVGHSNQLQLGGAASVGTNQALGSSNRANSLANRAPGSSNGRLV
jgi:hypothetical protein